MNLYDEMVGVVPYEGSATPPDDIESGITVYSDPRWPNTPPVYDHQRDTANHPNVEPGQVVRVVDIDWTVGGETGAVNRFPYVMNGIPEWEEHGSELFPHVPRKPMYGSYGDAGDSDDPNIAYGQTLASYGDPTLTNEESWAAMAAGI